VFAVTDATVLMVRDGAPDNVPGPAASFRPLVPNSMATIGGNLILLDLGGGRYAWYFHLQPGSLGVKTGDRVRRGQPLARIGCSGDSNLPHLHFEVTTSPKVMAGVGLPYVIDQYRVWTADNIWQARSRELPLDKMLIDFGS
jgi:murein DD-endopeptidase MepM/ murein hydrolase activator NlpD